LRKLSNGFLLRSTRARKIAGHMTVLGASSQPLPVSTFQLLFGARSLGGSLTGRPIDSEDTLGFSVLQDIRAKIETAPLAEAPAAYARMMRNEARFRMVLTMG
jgi:D-arabinose 1-dehydrogenase-like Zn-dependent alcohol dehydrogenase